MSIQFPQKRQVSDRKYHEAGVRGRFEGNLRIVRGRIDTTGPTTLEGHGFSVTKNSTGNVTMTFDPPFSAIPTTTASADREIGVTAILILIRGDQTPTTNSVIRLNRIDSGAASVDGLMTFLTVGPA